MDASTRQAADEDVGFSAIRIDISRLVGREIKLFSEQFPGRELHAKVTSAYNQRISVDSGQDRGLIENLVSQQQVVAQFGYKGQEISVRARLIRTFGGKCQFVLDEDVVPLSQRRYRRVTLKRPVRLAPFPIASHSRRGLSSLRWMSTDSLNLSSGGIMIQLPSFLEQGVYLLMNVDWDVDFLPPLVLGQVKHCHSVDPGQFRIGVEFIVSELARQLFSPARRGALPGCLFGYTQLHRFKLNRKLAVLNPQTDSLLLDRRQDEDKPQSQIVP
ncbi:MAG TPA: PilZ domain-containing protein [Acidobacteriota bacterium]|nr:PilZ domain-containing protein [Acidobacteriota bacterium]